MHLELRLQRQPHLEEFVAPYRASAGDTAISIHRKSRGAVDSGLDLGPELYASSGASAFAGRDRAATDTGLRPSFPGHAKEARTFRALIVTVARPQWCGMCKATPNGSQSAPECHQCVYSSCPTRLAARCPPVHSDRPNSTGLTEGPLSRRRTRGIFRNGTVTQRRCEAPKVPSVSICSVIEASSKQSQKAAGGQLSGSAPTCKLTEPSSGEEVFTPAAIMEPGSRRLDRNRKYASKNTTHAGLARYTNCSTVCTYDTRCRGKSKPATDEFRCEERIKNPRPNCVFDTASCIGDPQENVFAGRRGRGGGWTGASGLRHKWSRIRCK